VHEEDLRHLQGAFGSKGLPLQALRSVPNTRTVRTLCSTLIALAFALGLWAGGASAQVSQGDPLAVPGMDFSSLQPAQRKELGTVFDDEFCYCGCPHTVGQCLRTHTACKHAKREAALAASMAADGDAASDISVALGHYYQGFRAKHELTPDPKMCQGDPKASVTLIEYADFECPYCGSARPVIEKFIKSHPKVRLCFLPFPLNQHPNAIPAGQAALFARDHGKFWQLYDALFENQNVLSKPKIVDLAQNVGLDGKALQKVLESNQYVDELMKSRQAGIATGVDHTPTLFMNGHPMTLPIKPEYLAHAAEDQLEWDAHGGAWAQD
jgi:protein-disulfide isomerase